MARETAAERNAREAEEGFENVTEGPNNLPATQEPKTVTLKSAAGEETVALEELREVNFDALVSMFPDAVLTATEAIGTDQFGPILDEKQQLVGKPFVIVHWNFYPGTMGEFASMWVLTPDNERYIVNDGGSGIYQQLKTLSAKREVDSMLLCKHGLRVSEYDKDMPNGTTIHAKTYYIDTKL